MRRTRFRRLRSRTWAAARTTTPSSSRRATATSRRRSPRAWATPRTLRSRGGTSRRRASRLKASRRRRRVSTRTATSVEWACARHLSCLVDDQCPSSQPWVRWDAVLYCSCVTDALLAALSLDDDATCALLSGRCAITLRLGRDTSQSQRFSVSFRDQRRSSSSSTLRTGHYARPT